MILNTMRIASTYWNVQLQSLYYDYFREYCVTPQQIFEGSLLIAQTKYEAAEKLHSLAWYYGNEGTFSTPYLLPDFCKHKGLTDCNFSDLGEAEAKIALDRANSLGLFVPRLCRLLLNAGNRFSG